jgi:MoaA/NifB/PqqE/SkfB family radical SAM enzyme
VNRRRLELVLDLTSRCNLRCAMCHFSAADQLRFKPFDFDPGSNGEMMLTTFRHIAAELFPRAHTVALGCAAEPLLHPHFEEIVRICRKHRVPRVRIQTNLLALSPTKARTIVEGRVRTVAVSIDGTSRESYEKIRVGGTWERLLSRLELLQQVRLSASTSLPRLRITFTWMRTNRHELKSLPAFAESVGAREIDVRFVVPTVAVDNRDELLNAIDPDELMAELWATARDATARGLRLSAYPAMKKEPNADNSLIGKIRRKMWLLRAGIESPARWRRSILESIDGCVFPARMFLIRPNGAVLPCPFWEDDPIAVVPRDGHRGIIRSTGLQQIRAGLRNGCPIGSCQSCEAMKDALFRPLIGTGEQCVESL